MPRIELVSYFALAEFRSIRINILIIVFGCIIYSITNDATPYTLSNCYTHLHPTLIQLDSETTFSFAILVCLLDPFLLS